MYNQQTGLARLDLELLKYLGQWMVGSTLPSRPLILDAVTVVKNGAGTGQTGN